ncbi:MAG: hypothetical protein QM785_06710 [Pyrinomonadaceae bacterium]
MKYLLAVCLFIFGLSATASSQTFYGSTDLKVFRDGRDKEFRSKTESPLKEEDLGKFSGLNYFPVDNRFRHECDLRTNAERKVFSDADIVRQNEEVC